MVKFVAKELERHADVDGKLPFLSVIEVMSSDTLTIVFRRRNIHAGLAKAMLHVFLTL